MLRTNPHLLDTKFARLAITMLRRSTKDDNPEERFQKMEELAGQAFEGLNNAIEEL